MDIYLAGSALNITVTLSDRNGNALDAASVDYRIVNQTGAEVLARTSLSDFGGGSEVSIAIPAPLNTVAIVDPMAVTFSQVDSITVREVRTIELFVVDGLGNTQLIQQSYALEPADTLIVGLNSFQTYAQADLGALDIPNTMGWDGAYEKDRIAALVEARWRIVQLRFALLNSNLNFGQDNLNYVPEGTYPTPYTGMFMFNGNLAVLSPKQFVLLPARFLAALRKAQVAEADSLLGADPVLAKRGDGVILESIGEVKQMYRSGKPLELPVCKAALRYLSPFVTFSKKMGRG